MNLFSRSSKNLFSVFLFFLFGAIRDANDKTHLIRNHHADLRSLRCKLMSVRPIMCFQYTQRIAKQWQQMHGHRPEIYLTSQALSLARFRHLSIRLA